MRIIDYKEVHTIPNYLSLYRLVSVPFALWFIATGNQEVFVTLLVINLITDILDGFIARRFNMQTEIGARLDSMADNGTYLLAILGIFVFKQSEFKPYLFSFGLFLFLFILTLVVSKIKFGRMPSLHLYSWKIGGYMQGIFFFVVFVFGFYPWLYYLTITWGILAFTEHLIVQILIPEMRSNAKGLYWILKEYK